MNRWPNITVARTFATELLSRGTFVTPYFDDANWTPGCGGRWGEMWGEVWGVRGKWWEMGKVWEQVLGTPTHFFPHIPIFSLTSPQTPTHFPTPLFSPSPHTPTFFPTPSILTPYTTPRLFSYLSYTPTAHFPTPSTHPIHSFASPPHLPYLPLHPNTLPYTHPHISPHLPLHPNTLFHTFLHISPPPSNIEID